MSSIKKTSFTYACRFSVGNTGHRKNIFPSRKVIESRNADSSTVERLLWKSSALNRQPQQQWRDHSEIKDTELFTRTPQSWTCLVSLDASALKVAPEQVEFLTCRQAPLAYGSMNICRQILDRRDYGNNNDASHGSQQEPASPNRYPCL